MPTKSADAIRANAPGHDEHVIVGQIKSVKKGFNVPGHYILKFSLNCTQVARKTGLKHASLYECCLFDYQAKLFERMRLDEGDTILVRLDNLRLVPFLDSGGHPRALMRGIVGKFLDLRPRLVHQPDDRAGEPTKLPPGSAPGGSTPNPRPEIGDLFDDDAPFIDGAPHVDAAAYADYLFREAESEDSYYGLPDPHGPPIWAASSADLERGKTFRDRLAKLVYERDQELLIRTGKTAASSEVLAASGAAIGQKVMAGGEVFQAEAKPELVLVAPCSASLNEGPRMVVFPGPGAGAPGPKDSRGMNELGGTTGLRGMNEPEAMSGLGGMRMGDSESGRLGIGAAQSQPQPQSQSQGQTQPQSQSQGQGQGQAQAQAQAHGQDLARARVQAQVHAQVQAQVQAQSQGRSMPAPGMASSNPIQAALGMASGGQINISPGAAQNSQAKVSPPRRVRLKPRTTERMADYEPPNPVVRRPSPPVEPEPRRPSPKPWP